MEPESQTHEAVSLGRRISDLAAERRDATAIVFVPRSNQAPSRDSGQAPSRDSAREGDSGRSERHISWRELDERSTQLAHRLREVGVVEGELVGIALRNSPEHVIAALAIWKLGAGVLTLRWDVPAWERRRLVEVTGVRIVVAEASDFDSGESSVDLILVTVASAEGYSLDPLPDMIPKRPLAIPSGGSTGTSKAIVMAFPGAVVPGQVMAANWTMFDIEPIERNIVFGPLYHANPLVVVHASLLDGIMVVLHEKFDSEQILESIERHRPQYITFAPTMMKRLLETKGIEDVDWSCFHIVLHGTAPCPPWLKRRFIDLVGAERLWEIFASSELVGSVIVRGDEWLEHPGTVGRPTATTDLLILDDEGEPCAPGEVGEIYMRIKGTTEPLFDYLGEDRPKVTADGYTSVGDLGYLDEDGYLFSSDRRKDLIITGGANVVPAEVEAAISEHEGVADVAVVGIPDEEWGKRVHAIVVGRDSSQPPTEDDLRSHCRARLAAYKVPKSFELVDELPRSDMFKIRRSALARERTG